MQFGKCEYCVGYVIEGKQHLCEGLSYMPSTSKGISQLLDSRQKDYGDAKDNFTAIGRMWGALLQIEDIPAFQVALMMVQFKTVRASKNPHKPDSWDDLEGYAHHGRDLIPERDGE